MHFKQRRRPTRDRRPLYLQRRLFADDSNDQFSFIDLVARLIQHDAAIPQDRYVLAKLQDLIKKMRDEKHGRPVIIAQATNSFEYDRSFVLR